MTYSLEEMFRRGALSKRTLQGDEFDPELLFVECDNCGSPIFWEKGRTTSILLDAGISLHNLDARCMIMSHGCPQCSPEQTEFELQVVRLAHKGVEAPPVPSGNA